MPGVKKRVPNSNRVKKRMLRPRVPKERIQDTGYRCCLTGKTIVVGDRTSPRTLKETTECIVCQKIIIYLSAFSIQSPSDIIHCAHELDEIINIGSIHEVICSSTCTAHRKLLLPGAKNFTNYHPICSTELQLQRGPEINAINFSDDGAIVRISGGIELMRAGGACGCCGSNELIGLGKTLDSKWIDSGIFQNWKSACVQDHGMKCGSKALHLNILGTMPTRLIDVRSECLSLAPPDAQYAALSYTWGSTNSARTLRSTVDRYQQKGSLSLDQCRSNIPRTLIDAMALTKMLGVRYLWIDSLCIIQDDETSRDNEINNMGAIYAKALITIVAAQGTDADFGLRGLRSCQARKLDQELVQLDRQSNILKLHLGKLHPPQPTSMRENRHWHQRGWTFQECLFSPKLIIFEAETVRWECDSAVWYEDRDSLNSSRVGPIVHSNVRDHRKIISKPVPDIEAFFELVEEYMKRAFTYRNDVLRGFTGIINVIEQSFDGGFVGGHPVLWLDTSLLWDQDFEVTLLDERDYQFIPSWSWATCYGKSDIGFRKHIEFCHEVSSFEEMVQVFGVALQTLPLVSWSIRDRIESNSIPLGNQWFHHKTQADIADKLPPGWRRYEEPPQRKSWKKTRPLYTYDSDTYNTKCMYPVPCRPNVEPAPSLKGSLLSCRTKMGRLLCTEKLTRNAMNRHSSSGWRVLRTPHQLWAGVVKRAYRLDLPKGMDIDEHITCELVAISEGCTVRLDGPSHDDDVQRWISICPELYHAEAPDRDDPEPYRFYNCLWVEWRNGIAYRRSLARVKKDVWESLDLEEIDLVLG